MPGRRIGRSMRTMADILREVCTGVVIARRPPSEALLATGEFVTARDFARAGEDAGKSANFGKGVMARIAMDAYRFSLNQAFIFSDSKEGKQYWELFYMMRNPDEIKKGSQDRLLVTSQLVFNVLMASEGRISNEGIPTVGAVGQRILNCLLDDPEGELTEPDVFAGVAYDAEPS